VYANPNPIYVQLNPMRPRPRAGICGPSRPRGRVGRGPAISSVALAAGSGASRMRQSIREIIRGATKVTSIFLYRDQLLHNCGVLHHTTNRLQPLFSPKLLQERHVIRITFAYHESKIHPCGWSAYSFRITNWCANARCGSD
jgi:hypothetical protein